MNYILAGFLLLLKRQNTQKSHHSLLHFWNRVSKNICQTAVKMRYANIRPFFQEMLPPILCVSQIRARHILRKLPQRGTPLRTGFYKCKKRRKCLKILSPLFKMVTHYTFSKYRVPWDRARYAHRWWHRCVFSAIHPAAPCFLQISAPAV